MYSQKKIGYINFTKPIFILLKMYYRSLFDLQNNLSVLETVGTIGKL